MGNNCNRNEDGNDGQPEEEGGLEGGRQTVGWRELEGRA